MSIFSVSTTKGGGYALVEILVYLSVFTVMAIVITNSMLTLSRATRTLADNRAIMASATTVLERIGHEIRDADAIDTQTSVFDQSPGTLAVTNGSDTHSFTGNQGTVEFRENGSLVGNLISDDVVMTDLIFQHTATSESEGVRVALTLEAANTDQSAETFYTTIILRDSY